MVFQVHQKCKKWIRFFFLFFFHFDELNSVYFVSSIPACSMHIPKVETNRKLQQYEHQVKGQAKWTEKKKMEKKKRRTTIKCSERTNGIAIFVEPPAFSGCILFEFNEKKKLERKYILGKLGQSALWHRAYVAGEWIIHVNLCSRFDYRTTSWLPLQFYFTHTQCTSVCW